MISEIDAIVHLLRESGSKYFGRHVYPVSDYERVDDSSPDTDVAVYVGKLSETVSYDNSRDILSANIKITSQIFIRAVIMRVKPLPDHDTLKTDTLGKGVVDVYQHLRNDILKILGLKFDKEYTPILYSSMGANTSTMDRPSYDFLFQYDYNTSAQCIADLALHDKWHGDKFGPLRTNIFMDGLEIYK